MVKEIDELQEKIGEELDELIPTPYDVAYIFYDGGFELLPTFWFCYTDSETGKIIPADCIDRRKDINIPDADEFRKLKIKIFDDVERLQKLYDKVFEKRWYTFTYRLYPNGQFDISFEYDKPTLSWQERRENWCMKHIGEIPIVTQDMIY